MALRFYMDVYMDVHVPAAITEGLRRCGVDVLTSQEDGMREADDEELLNRSAELGRILFSQDQDLLRIASDWQDTQRSFHGLLFSQQQRAGIEDLELIAQCFLAEELANQIVFLPLR